LQPLVFLYRRAQRGASGTAYQIHIQKLDVARGCGGFTWLYNHRIKLLSRIL